MYFFISKLNSFLLFKNKIQIYISCECAKNKKIDNIYFIFLGDK